MLMTFVLASFAIWLWLGIYNAVKGLEPGTKQVVGILCLVFLVLVLFGTALGWHWFVAR